MTVSVLPFRTHPIVSTALPMARIWCAGHQIAGQPALVHAVRVAALLGVHVSTATPELVAAALLHDAPDYATVATGVDDLDAELTYHLSGEVARIVRALADQQQMRNGPTQPRPPIHDPATLLVGTADIIASLAAVLDRPEARDDPAGYWAVRPAFLTAIPSLRGYHQAAKPHLPARLADALHILLARAELVAAQHPPGSTPR